jgi:phage tail-like protein
MAMFPVNTHRLDPYRNYKFRVIADGVPIPGILRVSALVHTITPVDYRQGDSPNSYRVAPGMTRYAPITIERGLSHDTTFEDWAKLAFNVQGDAGMSLKNYRKDITINLYNMQGSVVLSYRVYRAWVAEYQALPALDANANCLAIERIVLEHEGWERDTAVSEPAET